MTELRKKIDLLYGVSDIKDLPYVIDQIIDAVKDYEEEVLEEKEKLTDEMEDLKSEKSGFEETIEELQQRELNETIQTGRSKEGIQWHADNLLDQQIMEALDDLLAKRNHLDILRTLQHFAAK